MPRASLFCLCDKDPIPGVRWGGGGGGPVLRAPLHVDLRRAVAGEPLKDRLKEPLCVGELPLPVEGEGPGEEPRKLLVVSPPPPPAEELVYRGGPFLALDPDEVQFPPQ